MPKDIDLNDQTPLMKQYWDLKSQAPDALLLFRMGDFYELFGDDAVLASQILEITLTSRDRNKPNPMPMAGVPHHSVQGYIQRLLKAGKKIAIGEQLEEMESSPAEPTSSNPGKTKATAPKIVKRKIVRILTPGVQFDAEGSDPNYLAVAVKFNDRAWVLACLDASTGEALVSETLDLAGLTDELRRLNIRHFLCYESHVDSSQAKEILANDSVLLESLPKNYLALERASEILKKHYDIGSLLAFISTDAGVLALGILVVYALRTQQLDQLAHLRLPEPLRKPKSLNLGPNVVQHLDLSDLFQMMNQTRCTLGARQLKRWMISPLRDVAEIASRQKAVKFLAEHWNSLGQKISGSLKNVYDLERICGRINTKLANPRDTLALGQSLLILKEIGQFLSPVQTDHRVLNELHRQIKDLSTSLIPLAERILNSQKEEAPLTSRDGGIFKTGTTPELDRLISLNENGQRWLIDLETREREQTGISSLKVRYNRVFGYYIEITQTHLKNVPAHYQRKQTMVGAERFFTEELKKFEEEILTASVKQKSLEQELFAHLIENIQQLSSPVMQAARALGEIDSLLALAHLAQQSSWCFPTINDSLNLKIDAGRHPVIDHAKRGSFVPNDLFLSPETRLTLMITGPNMGGKSTVMRQTALIVILGQMGAPIPAREATWGAFTSLFTRIGAQDAIARGQSTFMVEMSELAHILHHADERSLIILDEIGRGTSTYDGMSVAWATLEWICSQIQARTLFATHYHELTLLTSSLPLLANAHMAVEGTKEDRSENLRFLYELREGPTNESFGIHVAQIAGLPKPVIQRAWTVLSELESTQSGHSEHLTQSNLQLSLFGGASRQAPPAKPEIVTEVRWQPHPILIELQSADINQMTPLQAMNFLSKLQDLRQEHVS